MNKKMWTIKSRQIVEEVVVFDKEVSADEAEELYYNGEFSDVLDNSWCVTEAILDVN